MKRHIVHEIGDILFEKSNCLVMQPFEVSAGQLGAKVIQIQYDAEWERCRVEDTHYFRDVERARTWVVHRAQARGWQVMWMKQGSSIQF
jgi:hypothetical protein